MKAEESKVCPNCGTRNKPKWEFCLRCGESIQDVTVVMASPMGAVEAAAPAAPAEVEAAAGGWGGTLLTLAVFVAAVGVALTITRSPGRTDPALFAGPTLAPALPAPVVEPPPPGRADLARGRSLLMQGDSGALQHLAQAVADAPNDPDAQSAYAQALWQAGQREEALSHYELAARMAPPSGLRYRSDYAKALAASGRTSEAILEYEQILATNPDSPGSLRDLANLSLQAGNSERAVGLLRRAAELVPARAGLHEDLAQALVKAGATAEAIEAYRKALEIKPDADTSRNLLADLLYRQNQGEEAIAVVRAGLERSPNSAALHRGLASLLERSGRIQEAAAAYREYARLAPDAPDAKELSDRAAQIEKQQPSPPPGD